MDGHDNLHCMYLEKGHCKEATANISMVGCLLSKQLLHCPCWRGKREKISENSIIQKILTNSLADNKKSAIKNIPLQSILLFSCHQNKNKTAFFAAIVDYGLFSDKNEPSWLIQSKTKSMYMTNKNTCTMKNIIFTNLQ